MPEGRLRSSSTGLAASIDMLQHQLGNLRGALDRRTVTNLVQDGFAHPSTMRSPPLKDGADLFEHGLRRIDLVAGPTRHGAELAQRAEVKERGVANDLVLIATDPQQRRRLLDVSEAGSVAPRW